jgi:hypothetical protein
LTRFLCAACVNIDVARTGTRRVRSQHRMVHYGASCDVGLLSSWRVCVSRPRPCPCQWVFQVSSAPAFSLKSRPKSSDGSAHVQQGHAVAGMHLKFASTTSTVASVDMRLNGTDFPTKSRAPTWRFGTCTVRVTLRTRERDDYVRACVLCCSNTTQVTEMGRT